MSYNHRSIFIVPAAKRDAVNSALEAAGYGPDNLSVEMQTGAVTTHYLCDIAMNDAIRADFNSVMSSNLGEEHREKSFSQVKSEKNIERKVIGPRPK